MKELSNLIASPFTMNSWWTAKYLPDRRPEESWTVRDVLWKQPDLGMIIDLTFTDKYYEASVVQNFGVVHTKIKTKGHEIPADRIYHEFQKAIDTFYDDQNNSCFKVGVHCTHGLNRTGYLICRYLIERMNYPPDQAINAFEAARGYPIERQNYTADLQALKPSLGSVK